MATSFIFLLNGLHPLAIPKTLHCYIVTNSEVATSFSNSQMVTSAMRDVMEADLAAAVPALNVVVQQVMAIFEEGLLEESEQDTAQDDDEELNEVCHQDEDAPCEAEGEERQKSRPSTAR